MKVKKGNKVYRISETEEASYLAKGYDVVDKDGNVIKHAADSTVPYSEYAKVVKELEELKASSDAGKKGTKSAKDKAEDKAEEE